MEKLKLNLKIIKNRSSVWERGELWLISQSFIKREASWDKFTLKNVNV